MILTDSGTFAFTGVTVKPYFCHYCFNTDPALFYTFKHVTQEEVTYCRACIHMTYASTMTSYYEIDTMNHLTHVSYHLPFELTEQQQYASAILTEATKKPCNKLLHAVTGAGKTEMIVDAIATVLNRNGRVAIVSPRVDVVIELYERMKLYFNIPIDVAYAGVTATHHQFVICTVHQLFKYRRHFDFIIVDEIDAFPMSFDDRLFKAVQAAKKDSSSTIYLTATPYKMKKEFKGEDYIALPARYHGRPLPVPTFHYKSVRSMLKGSLRTLLKERDDVLLIFCNDVKLMQQIQTVYKEIPMITVNAKDALRHDKVEDIRRGKHRIILTTTILERGFTMEGLNVWVIDSHLFSAECLVQMAGRVDRKQKTYPYELKFFHTGISTSMLQARRDIQLMNKKARALGWLQNV